MKFVTYIHDDAPRLGALRAGRIIDLAAAASSSEVANLFRDMLSLIRAGAIGLQHARRLLETAPGMAALDPSGIRLLSPLPIPEQVRCFSAFEEHARNSSQVMLKKMAALAEDPESEAARLRASGNFNVPRLWYERPLYYKGNRFNWVGTDTDIHWPAYSQSIDYELELACIIGTTGRDIPKDDASNHIFGYAVCNDLSARDMQAIEMRAPLGPAKGKDFDGGNVLGPAIVTPDEINPYALTGFVRVNGEEWGRSSSSGMHHRFEDMIAYVSQSETLHAGEIFLSGCFGAGSAMEIGRSVPRGAVLELEIENLGVLKNRIV